VDLSPYGAIPSMIPPDYVGGPMATPKRTADAVLTDPMRDIHVPVPTLPPPKAPAPPQPQGWRNTLGTIVGDAIQGMAAAPSGSVNDIFKGMAATRQVGLNRRELERKQQLEEEARKRQIAEHEQQMRIREQEAKNRAEELEVRKQAGAERLERVKKATSRVSGAGDTPETRRAMLQAEYEAAVADGDVNAETYNPRTPTNRTWIMYGKGGNPLEIVGAKTKGATALEAAKQENRMALEGYKAQHAAQRQSDRLRSSAQLQAIHEAAVSGRLGEAQAERWADNLTRATERKESSLDRQDLQFDRDMDSLQKEYGGVIPPEGTPERAEYQRKEAAIKARLETGTREAVRAYEEVVRTNVLMRPGGGTPLSNAAPAVPAAGGAPAAPAAPAAPNIPAGAQPFFNPQTGKMMFKGRDGKWYEKKN